MKLDDVSSLLERCGLPDKEARAFIHLTRLGESKVTDLANAAELKRAETYQILERLQGRGLVNGTLARPRMFMAVPPDRAIALLVEERKQEVKAVEDMREEIQRRLESLAGTTGTESSAGAFRILQDHNQISGQLKRTIRAGQREICCVASSRSLFKLLLDEGLEDELRAATRDGKAKLRIITEILAGHEADAKRLAKFADVRHLMVPRTLRFFIADETEIVQYVTADALSGGAKETALWIGTSDHVQAQRAMFDDLWTEAIPAAARLEELATGVMAPQVRIVKGRFTRYEKQKEMLMRAKNDILLLLTSDEAERLAKSGIARALQARAKAGVRVRVLSPEVEKLGLAKPIETRAVKSATDLPGLVVDANESLTVMSGESERAQVTALDEYGVWVTLPAPVAVHHARLETLWKSSR